MAGKGPKMDDVIATNSEADTTAVAADGRGVTITSDVDTPSQKAMSALKLKISNSHYYKVTYEYDTTTSLINKVTIDYNP
jgi:hypothetical protein